MRRLRRCYSARCVREQRDWTELVAGKCRCWTSWHRSVQAGDSESSHLIRSLCVPVHRQADETVCCMSCSRDEIAFFPISIPKLTQRDTRLKGVNVCTLPRLSRCDHDQRVLTQEAKRETLRLRLSVCLLESTAHDKDGEHMSSVRSPFYFPYAFIRHLSHTFLAHQQSNRLVFNVNVVNLRVFCFHPHIRRLSAAMFHFLSQKLSYTSCATWASCTQTGL